MLHVFAVRKERSSPSIAQKIEKQKQGNKQKKTRQL
jgi:hypothetical protein